MQVYQFYDNSILSGTKMQQSHTLLSLRFTITQFFQVLKFKKLPFLGIKCFTITQFFQVLKYGGKLEETYICFTITQFFQVLKFVAAFRFLVLCFTITQFFQVLKLCNTYYFFCDAFYDNSILSGTKIRLY